MGRTIYQFPAQKRPYAEKTESWGIENIEAGITIMQNDTSRIRKKKTEMKINYDLVNGIIDEEDMENAFNPMGIKGVNFPAKTQNYPIEISKLNVLKGEESKRRFDYRVRSVNQDVISNKENEFKDQMMELIISEIQNENFSEEKAQRRLKQVEHYHKYEYQDMAEVMGQRILDYFWHTQKLKNIFSDNWYHVMIGAEEIYSCDIIHGEPELSRKHPLNISTFGSGNSNHIEDSDIIVDTGFHPYGKVIDMFWDVLDSDEVTAIEEGARRSRFSGDKVYPGMIDIQQETQDLSTSQLITVSGTDAYGYDGFYDEDGNVRVTRVIWASLRKIGQLDYIDPDGNEQTTIVSENFPIEQFKPYGWKITWFWIKEFWQGYKIGADIYKKIEALPRIGSKFSNPSYCLPPIVGAIYSIGDGPGISLYDRIKPYKYLYNVYMKRVELASARNKGVLAELDLAEIPDGWDEEMVMMFAEANGYLVHDSFNAGKEGIATGKIISTIKQRGPSTLNLNSSDIIRANLELAVYVKNELGEVAGISPQREGQIQNRETLGGVERSVTQSSHITEEWFRVHDITKLKTLELMLETAKYAWRNATGEQKRKLQYVDDGLITHIFTIDGRVLAESEYGYYISDGQSDTQLIQTIQQLSHALVQNDKATIKDLITIYRDTSVSSMIRKLEDAEDKANQREDDARREQLESNEKLQNAMQEIELMKMEQEMRIEMGKIDADIYEAELKLQAELAKIESQDQKVSEDRRHEINKLKIELDDKKKERAQKDQQFKEEIQFKKEELKQTLKSDEKIAKMKPKPQTIKK